MVWDEGPLHERSEIRKKIFYNSDPLNERLQCLQGHPPNQRVLVASHRKTQGHLVLIHESIFIIFVKEIFLHFFPESFQIVTVLDVVG